jgi:hypothetical protein
MDKKNIILTERQVEVLRLRNQGYSQVEIAKMLGTSKANISATEKSALKNIQKAKNTLELVKTLDAAIWIAIKPETDLNDAVREIYKAADKKGIWVKHSFPYLSSILKEKTGDKIKGRRVLTEFEVGVLPSGEIVVKPS